MAEEYQNIDERAIAKYLAGESSAEEQKAMTDWLSESEDNVGKYESLKKVWHGVEPGSADVVVDVNAAWEKLSERISEADIKDEERGKVFKLNPLILRIAAVIVLGLALFGIFRSELFNKEIVVASTNNQLIQDLPDGSKVSLNENSSISYSKDFDGDERKLELEGEAFFEVKRDKSRPFVVSTGVGQVKVLGTSFNIDAGDDNEIRVEVVTGLVEVSIANSTADSLRIQIPAGRTGIINGKSGRVFMEESNVRDDLFWLNKRIVFNKTPLPEVLKVLEKNYKVKFSGLTEDLEKCLLTARFKESNIEAILEVISLTFNLQFTTEGDTVKLIIKDLNCETL